MKYLFIEYPPCSTCKKAKKFLMDNGIDFIQRNIKEENPTKDELTEWLKKSNLPIKKFFNTSGQVYKKLNLKENLKNMTIDEQLDILSNDGMLVKRPILVGSNLILVGFDEKKWADSV